jgi:dTDP-4-dehydrorhamnose reductase
MYKYTLIVLGSNGMLGSYISSFISKQKEFKVINITRDDFDVFSNIDILENILKKFIKSQKKNIFIFNAIGLIPQSNNNISKDIYFKVNGYFPIELYYLCKQNNYKLIHPSTDCVFSGKKGNYEPYNEKDATDFYGISKIIADNFLQNTDTCIIRTSIIGQEKRNKKSLLEWVITNKATLNGYINHYWNGITCLEYAKLINNFITTNTLWNGIKHVGSEPICKYDLIQMINNVYECNLIIIKQKYYKTKDKTLLLDIETKPIQYQLQELKEYTKNE